MSLRSATETLTVVWSEVMFDVIMDTASLSFQNYIRFFLGTALRGTQTLVSGVDSQQLSPLHHRDALFDVVRGYI